MQRIKDNGMSLSSNLNQEEAVEKLLQSVKANSDSSKININLSEEAAAEDLSADEMLVFKEREDVVSFRGDPKLASIVRFNQEMPHVRLGMLEAKSVLSLVVASNH